MPSTPRCNIRLEPGDLTVEALATLDKRERKIVALRYGCNGFVLHSRKDVGRGLGISAVRVGQIEMAAARKLLALREPRASVETEIRLASVPRDMFPSDTDSTGTRRYRFTVDVVVDIGDREGGCWALRGVGKPTLKEVRRV